ncbi:unnamed protein product [Protopolystoma xenopodis]|uniref:Uncharacterized protein n=1 Tax=Protopolystoma xenopodis TaxID=117903 RepID=A0A448XLV4_9PLAT|nr:unnamed protein product [Protopolystoma xenopodis]
MPAGASEASAHTGGITKPPYDRPRPIVHLDVAFLPGGGSHYFVDVEWFKRVRARHYIATDPMVTSALMEAILVGKESWTEMCPFGEFTVASSYLFVLLPPFRVADPALVSCPDLPHGPANPILTFLVDRFHSIPAPV